MTNRANQQQIADILDISQMAVSKALRDQPGVSDATRQLVLDTAQRLGYRHNRLAASLKHGRSHLIGALFPNFPSPFFYGVLHAAEEFLRDNGYSLLLRGWSDLPGTDQSDLDALQQFQADGLLVIPRATMPWSESVYPELLAARTPIVFLDRHVTVPGACSVVSDNRGGARAATRHLLEAGHRRIAMLNTDTPYNAPAVERETAFRETLAEAGLDDDGATVVHLSSGLDAQEIDAALDSVLRVVDAIFCFSDNMAMVLMACLQRRKIRVPDDVAVVGFGDNISYMENHRVPLTTVSQSPDKMGRAAAEALLEKMRGEPVPERIEISSHLVVRESSGRRKKHGSTDSTRMKGVAA